MAIQPRAYHDQEDLAAIGRLIRQVYKLDPFWNSWSFALYDIWAWRKLGDQVVFGATGWQDGIRLWVDEGDALVGAAVFRDPDYVKVVVWPENHELLTPMLDWLETRFTQQALPDKSMTIESIDRNPYFESLLASRGYKRKDGYYHYREKDLRTSGEEAVNLPEGFCIQHIETPEDLRKFHHGTELVFNFPDNPDVYQVLRRAPSFRTELDLIVLSPDGEIASFGSIWFEESLSLAEFEPVGTVPEFRKMGLGAALIAEASNRLRHLGCSKVSVTSWSKSAGANRLYEKAGLLPVARKNYWKPG